MFVTEFYFSYKFVPFGFIFRAGESNEKFRDKWTDGILVCFAILCIVGGSGRIFMHEVWLLDVDHKCTCLCSIWIVFRIKFEMIFFFDCRSQWISRICIRTTQIRMCLVEILHGSCQMLKYRPIGFTPNIFVCRIMEIFGHLPKILVPGKMNR